MNLDAIFNGLAKVWQSLPEAVFAFLLGYLLIKLLIWFLHKILKSPEYIKNSRILLNPLADYYCG